VDFPLKRAAVTRPRRQRGQWRKRLVILAAGLAAIAAVMAIVLYDEPLADRMRDLVFDGYQRLAPRQEAGAPITVVDIDEASVDKLGQWPWPRTTIAQIVDRLTAMGAATVAFDIVFSEPDRTSPSRTLSALQALGAKIDLPPGLPLDNDAVLVAAFARTAVVAGMAISNETSGALPPPKAGFSYGGDDPKTYLPRYRGAVSDLPSLVAAAQGLGFFSFPPSADGVVRSLPLVEYAQGNLFPALSVEALRLAQGASAYAVRSTGASGEANTGESAMTAFKVGAFSAPTGPHGELTIYYSGMPNMPTISAADVLDPAKTAAVSPIIAGSIVLVGTSAVGLRDLVQTPIGGSVPGVRVHAEVIDQLMGQSFLSRPDWARGAEILAALLFGILVITLEALTGAGLSSFGTMLLLAIATGASWTAFRYQHLLLDPILPSAAALLVFVFATPVALLWTDREKRFIRSAFSRYLSPELVGRLADNPQALQLGGELRELTVLFSDIRGFTSLSEHLGPGELTALLNNFLTPATDVLLASEATIDKYIGDAIMAFWNAPLQIDDHRRKACLGALRMVEGLSELNRQTGLTLRVGIGLNTGECCVGNLGSAQRFSYSAIGDAVNVSSRVEGMTKQYKVAILVTEATRSPSTPSSATQIWRRLPNFSICTAPTPSSCAVIAPWRSMGRRKSWRC
jgi:adenylate cyclase